MKTAPHYDPSKTSALRTIQERIDLTYYLRAVYGRRWIAIASFLIVFLTLAINSLKTTPVYQARAQMLIEKDQRIGSLAEGFQQQDPYYEDDFYQTQYRILQSRSLARETIDAMGLWNDSRFGGQSSRPAATSPSTPSSSLRAAVHSVIRFVKSPVQSVVSWIGPKTAPTSAVADETVAQSRIVDAFLNGLGIVPVKNSRLVDVTYTSPDPVFAARAANGVARTYIQQNLQSRFLSTKETSDWLSTQLEEQRRKVDQSEAALQQYKETHDAVAVEDRQNIVVQRLGDLNAVVTKAKTDRIEKEAIYYQFRRMQDHPDGLDSFPAVLSNEYIQKLKSDLADLQRQQAQLAQKYGERHPEMLNIRATIQTAEAKLKAETGKIVDSVHAELLAARAREQSLVQALEAQKADALSLNRKGIEYAVLQRDAVSNRQIFESLLQRTKETGISRELKTSNIRVIDPAEVPRSPIAPNSNRDMPVAFFAGLFTALAFVFLFEYVDNRVRVPEEIKTHLGLPFLGLVPAVRTKDLNGNQLLLNNGVPHGFAEALRGVRTNVLFSSAEEGAKSLVVTSTGPAEGKTVVSCNLAVALAQADQRVVLVDADMRRPRVHTILSMSQEPGLSNLLVGTAQQADVLVQHEVPNLWTIVSGHEPPNPAELLASHRFRQLLDRLKEQFDWIIIDTPPVLAVTDASVVAHVTTGVVFVVGADMTSRASALVALDQLEASKARFVGGILNRVNLRRHGYYYSPYYRRSYSGHYSSTPPHA